MKIKFNIKLTAFLVSLFMGLLLVILGSKNQYCLSFGFIVIGVSLEIFSWYNTEKVVEQLSQLNSTIDEVDVDEDLGEEEKVYVLKELYIRQKKLDKSKKLSRILFSIAGVSIAILGFVGLF